MRRATILLTILPLAGCEEFLDALVAAIGQPKIAYEVDGPAPLQPTVELATLQDDDRALRIGVIDDFNADGSIAKIALSPTDDYLAVGHTEEGFVTEGRIFVFDANSRAQLAFETDNTIESEINALCLAGTFQDPFLADIPGLIGDGVLAPDTDGVELLYFDSPNNVLLVNRWLDDDRLSLQVTVDYTLTFLAPSGNLETGVDGDATFYLDYEPQGGAWAPTACSETPPGDPVIPLTRDVSLGAALAAGQEILLDGSVLIDLNNQPVAPQGARKVDGPYR